jgi:CheY-specific phosphatase CheX
MAVKELTTELVHSLRDSIREVLQTMVFVTPTTIEVEQYAGQTFSDEVIGLLSFTGTQCGMLCIRSTENTVKTMVAQMLSMEPGEFASFADAVDGFGEVVNMVTGSFKNTWVTLGNTMDLSVPTVIYHGYVSLGSSTPGLARPWVKVVLPFGAISVGIVFEAD